MALTGKQLRAQVYRDAVDFYFVSGTAKALKDALAVDPSRRRESVWQYRASASERVNPNERGRYAASF